MTSKSINQLTAHPESATSPLSPTSLLVLRDPTLAGSDLTRKVRYDHISGYTTNALNFGADSTGAADSTAAIQAAIDAAGQGVCYIPAGFYSVTKLIIPQGVTLKGAGLGDHATVLIQPDGVNDDLIRSNPALDGSNYIHYTRVMDLCLLKTNGGGCTTLNVRSGGRSTDTGGHGIYFPNFCGEGTKFQNLLIAGFPNHGLRVRGAIPCWFQDLHIFNCGVSQEAVDLGYHPGPAQEGYGLYLENGVSGFTGHYVIGVSGDNNASALIGARQANVTIMGVKAEAHSWQNYVVELAGDSNRNWCILNGVTATLNASISPRPSAVAHITNANSGYDVWVQGVSLHTGAVAPDSLIIDDVQSPPVAIPYEGRHQMLSYYSSGLGAEVLKLCGSSTGSFLRVGGDPPAAAPGAWPYFALGLTNGVGLGGSTNITALAKGAATNAPTSLVVNRWVRAQLQTALGQTPVDGWIPFFV